MAKANIVTQNIILISREFGLNSDEIIDLLLNKDIIRSVLSFENTAENLPEESRARQTRFLISDAIESLKKESTPIKKIQLKKIAS